METSSGFGHSLPNESSLEGRHIPEDSSILVRTLQNRQTSPVKLGDVYPSVDKHWGVDILSRDFEFIDGHKEKGRLDSTLERVSSANLFAIKAVFVESEPINFDEIEHAWMITWFHDRTKQLRALFDDERARRHIVQVRNSQPNVHERGREVAKILSLGEEI